MIIATATVVSHCHAAGTYNAEMRLGYRIDSGEHAGTVFVAPRDDRATLGEVIAVKYHPDDQYAYRVQPGTVVDYIGHGERSRDIEKLFEMLDKHPLDPTFEGYGDFLSRAERHVVESYNEDPDRTPLDPGATYHSFGNFYTYSCAFSVYTSDPAVIDRLTAAIKANKGTAAYKEARDERTEQRRQRAERDAEVERRRQRDDELRRRY